MPHCWINCKIIKYVENLAAQHEMTAQGSHKRWTGIAVSHATRTVQFKWIVSKALETIPLKINQLRKQLFYIKGGKSRHKVHLQWTGNRSMTLSSVLHSGSREWPVVTKNMDPEYDLSVRRRTKGCYTNKINIYCMLKALRLQLPKPSFLGRKRKLGGSFFFYFFCLGNW